MRPAWPFAATLRKAAGWISARLTWWSRAAYSARLIPSVLSVFDALRGVAEDDINEVMHIARTINLPHDREVLHSIAQKYTVGLLRPESSIRKRCRAAACRSTC